MKNWIKKAFFGKRDAKIEALETTMVALKIDNQKHIDRVNKYWKGREYNQVNRKK